MNELNRFNFCFSGQICVNYNNNNNNNNNNKMKMKNKKKKCCCFYVRCLYIYTNIFKLRFFKKIIKRI